MVISLLAIFILAMAASIYCIVQLRQLDDLTKAIIRVDARSIILEQDLLNTFLSMMRYEKKYFIIKDEGLYKQYLLVKSDFDRAFERNSISGQALPRAKAIASVVNTAEARDLLAKINHRL